MSIDLKYANDAREEMANGIKKLYDAVRVTLGPRGKNVIIEQEFGTPLITNDGVTIAKAIELANQYENLGASILIEAASKTNDVVGDGTTTAILLASEIIFAGLSMIKEDKSSVMIRKGLEYYLPFIVNLISEKSMPVTSSKDLNKIASISSRSTEVGDLLEQAYLEVGIDGVITLQESSSVQTDLIVTKGYSFDRGLISPYLSKDGDETVELDKPLILITDKKITMMQEIVPFLEESMKKTQPLLIICEDMDASVLNAIIVNKLRGVFNAVVVKAPSFGDRKTKQLEDIAIFTKGTFLSGVIDSDIATKPVTSLGSAEKVVISKDQTTIMDGFGSTDDIIKRTESLKNEFTNTTSEYEKEKLKDRIAKLLGGVAVIRVGSPTETELKDLKLRIEDAINATKAASIKGIIEGGGKVFYQISNELEKIEKPIYSDAKNILITALKKPFYQIIENAGKSKDIVNELKDNLWYDAESDQIVSLTKAGVIDPTSVAINAITNAISVASIFLTTECAIIKKVAPKEIEPDSLL